MISIRWYLGFLKGQLGGAGSKLLKSMEEAALFGLRTLTLKNCGTQRFPRVTAAAPLVLFTSRKACEPNVNHPKTNRAPYLNGV